jgi:predicted AAA+ superfamily ATPase
VINHLARWGQPSPGTETFGRAFEHVIFLQLAAHASYSEIFYPVTYWRTASGFEVDYILGDAQVAIEVKSSDSIRSRHLKGMRAFKQEFKPGRCIVVSMEPQPRRTEDGIDILPWRSFLEMLWGGEMIL